MIVCFFRVDLDNLVERFAEKRRFRTFAVNSEVDIERVEEDFVFVLSPERITESLVNRCNKISSEKNIYFGFVTGLNDEIIKRKLEEFETESVLQFEDSIILLRKENGTIEHEVGAYVLTRPYCYVEKLNDITKNRVLLSAIMDGNRRHLHLNDGKICGINSLIDIDEVYKYFPECQVCEYKTIKAEQMNVEAMFMNSCSSTLINTSEKGKYINVGMNILKNAKLLISAYRPKQGYINEALLFYYLVNTGYSAGEIVYILNTNSYYHGSEYLPYILYGFPNAKKMCITKAVSNSNLTIGKDVINIDVAKFEFFEEVSINLDDKPELFEKICERKYRVLTDNTITQDIYYLIIPYPLQKVVKIFLYGWKKISKKLKLSIRFESYQQSELALLTKKYKNMQKLKLVGFNHQKVTSKIRNYFSQLNSVVPYTDERLRNLKNDRLVSKIRQLIRLEEELYTTLKEFLTESNPYFFIEQYEGNVVIRCADKNIQNETKCPYCGNFLSIKEAFNEILDIRRLSAFCSNCHNVYDIPYYGESIRFPFIEVRNYTGKSIDFTVHVKNDNPHSTHNSLYFNVWCESRSDFKNLNLTKQFEIFNLQPSEKKSIDVSVSLKDFDRKVNQSYCLYVYWFEDFDIFVSTYTFKLRNINA